MIRMLGRKIRARRALLALAFIVTLFTTSVAHAESLTLAWDANPESDVIGYYVFIGTSSGVYSTIVDVGSATTYTFSSAVPGTTYYLTVAAYVAGPVIGQHAPEVVTTIGGGPSLNNPGNRTSSRGTAVTLALSASDPNNDPITFGASGLPTGLSIDSASGVISGTPTVVGTFDASVTAADPSSSTATQFFTWTIVATDTTAPTISVTSPTSNASYATSSAFVTLSGIAADDVGVTSVAWANSKGGSGTAAGTASWSVIVPLQSGSNVITMSASDASGKSTNAVLTVSVDLSPTVTIVSPTSASSYSSATETITLAGSASDDAGVSSVTWSNSRGGSGTATGTASWTAVGIVLQSGTNLITITAQDGTGHSSTATLSISAPAAELRVTGVTADKTAPQAVGTTITFTVAASGGNAPYQYKWWLYNGASWILMSDWTTAASLPWTPVAANGSYRIGVWVRNAGSTADTFENNNANGAVTFPITAAVIPLTLANMSADRSSPQVAGSAITFAASATGGTPPYSYKWRVFNGSFWTVAQTWSTSASFAWMPTTAGSGYQIDVWARSSGNSTDAAENSAAIATRTFTITAPPTASTALSMTSLTADLNAPQVVGTRITFTANASGGRAPYTYKWWLYNGSSWILLSDWTTAASLPWTPTAANSVYRIGVWVRNAGSSDDTFENNNANGAIMFPVTTGTAPLAVTGLSVNRPSPQTEGTAITFTAAATGGTGPYSYKWRVFNGSMWVVAQTWSTNATFAWTPTVSGSGYQIEVWARSSGSATDAADNSSATATSAFTVTEAPTTRALSVVSLTADKSAPQVVGSTIVFIAAATGGTAPYSYKWFLYNGSSWMTLREWSTAATVTWTPTSDNAGYRIGVWARNAGSTADAFDNNNANGGIVFPITPAALPLSITSVTANKLSPQLIGVPITFSAAAIAGTGPYSYKWRVFNGVVWTVAQNWSTNASFVWTPFATGSSYQIEVWARSAGNSADAPENAASDVTRNFTITYSPSSPTRLIAMTADVASPMAVGTPITVSTTVVGGGPQYHYKWWLFNGTSWILLTDWTVSASWTWTPSVANANYRIGVWVRSSTSTADASDNDASNGSVQFVVQ